MTEKTKERLLAKQYKLTQSIIKDASINIVTCGMCGDVLLHKLEVTEVKCPYCGYMSEPCDFPDLFY